MTVVSVTDPPKGTASLAPGGSGVRYIPTANANGDDEFDYTLNGGSTATVTVHITPVDDPPVAGDRHVHRRRRPARAGAARRPTNDTDIDGGPKTIVGVDGRTKGTVAIVGGGTSLTYMPAANATGAGHLHLHPQRRVGRHGRASPSRRRTIPRSPAPIR